jgi:hypothetical protein
MPGGTELVRFRPRRTRVVAWVAAVVVLLAAVGLAAALSGTVSGAVGSSAPEGTGAANPGPAVFGTADRVALIGLGLIGAAALLSLTRPLVEADTEGIRVRNIVGGCQLPWGVVRAVRFDRGASWATLELHDDETVGVLAVQAVDKSHAVTAVRALRTLHAAHQRRHREQAPS